MKRRMPQVTERTEAGVRRLHRKQRGEVEGGWWCFYKQQKKKRRSDGTDEPGSDASVELTSGEEP